MISVFRKHQQWLMILITILIIFVFLYYWNGPGGHDRSQSSNSSNVTRKIYGNTISPTMFLRERKKAEVAIDLGMRDLVNTLAGKTAASRDAALDNFAWNSLVLRHEADALQIKPFDNEVDSDQEVKTAIMALPRFQTPDGQFDSGAYTRYVSERLQSFGFTDSDLNQLVAEQVRMNKISELLKSTLVISESEFLAQYTFNYQVTHVSVIHFDMQEIAAGIQVTDQDIKAQFEQHLESYQSGEKRGLKYVAFDLSDADKKLEGKERTAALQKLSDDAQAFAQAMLEKGANFDEIAAKDKLTVTNVPPFAAAEPDQKLIPTPYLISAAFGATKQDPNSDVIPGPNGFYVAQLQEIVPSKQLTLAEARTKIIDDIKNKRAQESISTKALETRNKILVAMNGGKSFADAAKDEKVKVEEYPPFSLADLDEEKPDARIVLLMSEQMKDGELSQFQPTEDGGILVHVDKRDPIDKAKFEKERALLQPRFISGRLYFVLDEWLRTHRLAANVQDDSQPKSAPGQQQPQQ